jgi:hypothetical protein
MKSSIGAGLQAKTTTIDSGAPEVAPEDLPYPAEVLQVDRFVQAQVLPHRLHLLLRGPLTKGYLRDIPWPQPQEPEDPHRYERKDQDAGPEQAG